MHVFSFKDVVQDRRNTKPNKNPTKMSHYSYLPSFISQSAAAEPSPRPVESGTHSPLTAPTTRLWAGAYPSFHVYPAQFMFNCPGHHNYVFIKDQDSIVLALTVVESDVSNENKTSLCSVWAFWGVFCCCWLGFFKHNF